MRSLVPVGQVLSAHGIKGEVNFRYYNEVYQDFFRYTSLFYEENGDIRELKIKGVRLKEKNLIIKFDGIEDRTSAEKLRGKILFVEEKDLPDLEEGEYYVYQVIGSSVLDESERFIGKVRNVLRIGPNCILEIVGDEEILIPMVDDFVLKIDVKEKVIMVRRPEYI